MITCPSCNGRGGGEGFMCGPGNCGYGFISCSLCKKSGQVSEEAAKRYAFGRTMAKERIGRRVASKEEASRLGVDWPEWTRIESGGEPETDAGRAALERRTEEMARNKEN